jgi:molecular chaperone DnaK
MPQIEVAFDIDANGILNVSAKDTATASNSRCRSRPPRASARKRSSARCGRPRRTAAEDARRKQDVELRNQTDALVYQTERTLNEAGAGLDGSERQAVEQGLADARDALRSDDMDRIRRAYENLTRGAQTLSQAASRQTRGGRGGPEGGQPSGRPSDGEGRGRGVHRHRRARPAQGQMIG